MEGRPFVKWTCNRRLNSRRRRGRVGSYRGVTTASLAAITLKERWTLSSGMAARKRLPAVFAADGGRRAKTLGVGRNAI